MVQGQAVPDSNVCSRYKEADRHYPTTGTRLPFPGAFATSHLVEAVGTSVRACPRNGVERVGWVSVGSW